MANSHSPMGSYQVCSRCIMDTSAAEITFDAAGVCSFCAEFVTRTEKRTWTPQVREKQLASLLTNVRETGRGKPYDCIVGVSGGADSSYALYQAKKLGLRPLAVHLDNGWNSELAVSNIERLVRALNVDLYTHVVEWAEFRDLQLSFMRAGVIDIELLTDNAMAAVNYQAARKHGLKHILAGTNNSTEGMRMPVKWNRFKFDVRNIKAIQRRFGRLPIKTLPTIGTAGFILNRLRGVQWISFLDYFEYHKARCMEVLQREVGFRPYPYKHYESVFTRFYQGYILPNKFGVDKRRLHLSNLIMSGQLTRELAMNLMQESPYPSSRALADDRSFVLKKLGLSEADFESYMSAPGVPHDEYGNEKWMWEAMFASYRKVRTFIAAKQGV